MQNSADNASAITVAHAAPAIPNFSTATKSKSRITLSRAEAIRK